MTPCEIQRPNPSQDGRLEHHQAQDHVVRVRSQCSDGFREVNQCKAPEMTQQFGNGSQKRANGPKKLAILSIIRRLWESTILSEHVYVQKNRVFVGSCKPEVALPLSPVESAKIWMLWNEILSSHFRRLTPPFVS